MRLPVVEGGGPVAEILGHVAAAAARGKPARQRHAAAMGEKAVMASKLTLMGTTSIMVPEVAEVCGTARMAEPADLAAAEVAARRALRVEEVPEARGAATQEATAIFLPTAGRGGQIRGVVAGDPDSIHMPDTMAWGALAALAS